jgi:amino acid adenylation domain-containing protein
MEESFDNNVTLNWWRLQLRDAPKLDLPSVRSGTPPQRHRIGHVDIVIPDALFRGVRERVQNTATTVHELLLAVWTLLLTRLSRQKDIVIGVTVPAPVHDGALLNPVPLRINLDGRPTIAQLLDRVNGAMAQARVHRDASFSEIVGVVGSGPDPDCHPLFQAAFAFTEMSEDGRTHERPIPASAMTSGDILDVALSLQCADSNLLGQLSYRTDLCDRPTVDRWIGYFLLLLAGTVTSDEEVCIGVLPILSRQEWNRVTNEFNSTDREFPVDVLIHQIFEAHAEEAPDRIAVLWGGHTLSYRQLNESANQLAHTLHHLGVMPGEYVPLAMRRSQELIVSQLAVLKCGAAYVPLDPNLPTDRQAYIVRHCGAKRVICEHCPPSGLSRGEVDWTTYPAILSTATRSPGTNLELTLPALSPAYMMYTSGSTGEPKGVSVPHRGVVRLVINSGYADLMPTDRIAHCSNVAFDAATFEIWGALLNRACLIILSENEHLEPDGFAAGLAEHNVTTLLLTTALFNHYASSRPETFTGLRYVLFGGDKADIAAVERVSTTAQVEHLLNVYGPTENTTFTTFHPIISQPVNTSSIPIGAPISNTSLYILDEEFSPVPIGVVGEVFVGGSGVALGYLNRPDLTAERFVPDAFGHAIGHRLYRTGDLGRWQSGGVVEFLGRNDHQVKIRGFRIELEEIEGHISRHVNVKESVVLARNDTRGEKRLVAYVVTNARDRTQVADFPYHLRSHLKSSLPEYMIPAAIVCLDRMPLTSNGKIDRATLPPPGDADYVRRPYIAPRGGLEEMLAEIWRKMFSLQQVGRDDHFFELGGTSIQGMEMAVQVARRLNVSMPPTTPFRCPTLREIAQLIGELQPTDVSGCPRERSDLEEGSF